MDRLERVVGGDGRGGAASGPRRDPGPDREGSGTGAVRLLVSVDTEEDQWGPTPGPTTVENLRELPRLHRLFRELGVRPTYFVSYQVAARDASAAVLRELAGEDGVEIGAHLHPWNTPPVDPLATPRDSMLRNLPARVQGEKLHTLTRTLTRAFGERPRSFRAGRLGLGPTTVGELIRGGYRIDSSVAPFLDWTSLDDGPSFVGAPLRPYRLSAGGDVRTPDPGGALLEIPISVGFTRRPFSIWAGIHRALEGVSVGERALSGILSRAGLLRKAILSPELDDTADMLQVGRALIREGIPHLHLVLHSSTLVPGLTPFAASASDVDAMLDSIRTFVLEIGRAAPVRCATVSEFGRELGPVGVA